jgi:hypothetical protein
MITAQGEAPATLFLMTNRERNISPSRTAASVGALFLGIQIQCAECHNHPITRDWKRKDFWGMAAFFARTRVPEKEKGKDKPSDIPPGIRDVDESPRAFVPRPDPKKPAPPPGDPLPPGVLEIPDATDPMKIVGRSTARFLEGEAPDLGPTGSHRQPFADWLTSPDNRYFARVAVNRTWSYFFARGFVNPVDDMGPDNPASHPAALDRLTREFVAARFDLRYLARCICNTRAYQRTSAVTEGNETDTALFSHMSVKVIEGPILLALLDQVLGKSKLPEPTGDRKKGSSATRPTADLLDTAGYDPSPDQYTMGVPQALRLMNVVLPGRARRFAEQLVRSRMGQQQVVEHLDLAALSRRPTAVERREIEAYFSRQEAPATGYAGVVWAVLASPEFVSNP